MKFSFGKSLFSLLYCLLIGSYSFGQGSCAEALEIQGTGVYFGSTVGVPYDVITGPMPVCTISVDYSGQVWYKYTAPSNGTLSLSTLNNYTFWDTKIHVYSGVCAALQCEGSNDDVLPSYQSSVTVSVFGGVTYFIRVSGYNYYEGMYKLDVSYTPDNFNVVNGCTNQAACNYNPLANQDDFSCCYGNCYGISVTTGLYPSEVSWYLVDGNNYWEEMGGAPYAATACMSTCNYSVAMFDSWGDGWNNTTFNVYNIQTGGVDFSTTMPLGEGPLVDEFVLSNNCNEVISGCTNSAACNFEPAANSDDGSCCFGECYSLFVEAYSLPYEVGWSIASPVAGEVSFGTMGISAPYAGNFCVVDPSCDYSVTMYDASASSWANNQAYYYIGDPQGNFVSSGTKTNYGYTQTGSLLTLGDISDVCLNPQASNYAPGATCGDYTSCIYCYGAESAYELSVLNTSSDYWGYTIYIWNNQGEYVFSTFVYGGVSEFHEWICLNPGCYFVSIVPEEQSAIVDAPDEGGLSGTRGLINHLLDWTITTVAGDLIASGMDSSVSAFHVGNASCAMPFADLQVIAPSYVCNGDVATIQVIGMPYAQLTVHDYSSQSYQTIFLDQSGSAFFVTNSIYGSAYISVYYAGSPNSKGMTYHYPLVLIQGTEPPVAAIVSSDVTICQGGEVIVTLQGTPNSDAHYTIWATELDMIYEIYEGSVVFDSFGYAYVSTGYTTQSLNYYLESVAFGNCINTDVYSSFYVDVQDPQITEYELSTTANVFCAGDLIETAVDFGYPESTWNPNTLQGGTPGSYYGWYVLSQDGYFNGTYNNTAYSNQVSINLGTTTPGHYSLMVYEYTAEGCFSSTLEFPFEVRDFVSPNFANIGPYCIGETPQQFPTTSPEGITGSWFPPVVTTNYGSLPDYYVQVNYNFYPDDGQCAYNTSKAVTVIAYPETQLTVDGPTTFCQGDQVIISAADAMCYRWLGNSGCSPFNEYVATTSGTYSVYLINSFNNHECDMESDAVVVTVLSNEYYYADADGDGFGNPNVTAQSCNPLAGYVLNDSDCNDANAAINPNANEVCDGVDNDCDFLIDELPANAIVDCNNNCLHDSNNNGVCDENEQVGCTDPTACNYDSNATTDNGLCTYPLLFLDCAGNCLNDLNGNGICDEVDFEGCTDMLACNYVLQATFDDGSCQYPGCTDANACNFDSMAGCDDSSCEFPGCTDATALNYDAQAGCNDNSCIYEGVGGCTDIAACNYDALADFDDGTCQYAQAYRDCFGNCNNDVNENNVCDEQEGCTDPSACNYDAQALLDNGLCDYPELNLDCDGNCLLDTDGDGICDASEFPGCTNPVACNFNPAATDEDGTCTFAQTGYDCDGNCIVDTNSNGICDPEEGLGCMNETACNYDPNANVDNGTCQFATFGYDCSGNCLLDTDADGVCDLLEVLGCTDALACNFNQQATDEDGSCQYAQLFLDCSGNCLNDVDGDNVCDELEVEGCTNVLACNYSISATEDDGSCIDGVEIDPLAGPSNVFADSAATFATSAGNGLVYQWIFTPNAFCANPCDGNEISVIFPEVGSYSITVIAGNESYPMCSDTMSTVVTVEQASTVSNVEDHDFCTVYPNPTTGVVNLQVAPRWLGARAELVDVNGRLLWKSGLSSTSMAIDLSAYSVGIYSLTLVAPQNAQHRTLRVIKN